MNSANGFTLKNAVFRKDVFIFKFLGVLPEGAELNFYAIGQDDENVFSTSAGDRRRRPSLKTKVPHALYRVPLADCPRPVKEFRVTLRTMGEEHILSSGKKYSLDRLFVSTQQEYAEFFNRKKTRPADPETTAFAVRQIVEYYSGPKAQVIASSVIYAYKAMEIGDLDMVDVAHRLLADASTHVAELPRTDHVRTDQRHLESSLMVAAWHLRVFVGDLPGCLEVLEASANAARLLDKPIAITAFNHCRGFLLYAYLKFLSGDYDSARQLAADCFKFYRRAFAGITGSMMFFGEMREAHEATYQAMRLRDKIADPQIRVTEDEVFSALNRLLNRDGIEKLRTGFSAICSEAGAGSGSRIGQ